MNPNDSNDVYAAACIERFHERHRVLDVIRRGAEDDAPPPEERLLGADFCRPFAATANDYSLDVPTSCAPPDFRAPIDPGVTTSAPFVPTLEQAHHSATCAALYSRGATERQALDFLYRETVELRAQLIKLAESAPVPMVIADGYARGRDDERRRVESLALYHLDHTQPGPRTLLAAIRSGKAAP